MEPPPVAGVNCAAPTVIAGLVLAVLLPSEASLAVTVALPGVFRPTANDRVPEINAALEGKVAPLSLDVMLTVSAIVLTRFQFASTAFTVTLNGVPTT